VLAGPILAFAPAFVHFFKMSPAQYPAAATLLRIIFALLILSMIFSVPGMVVVSMQRMDLASRNDFTSYLAYAAFTFVFLKLHYGIAAVVIGQAAQIVVAAVTQLVTAHRLFGPIWHNPLRIERPILKRLFGFGSWMQLNAIFTIVNLDVGRFIAAGIVSVASVGLFEIAGRLAFFAKVFPGYLLDALMPAAASADARNDEGSLDRMYAAATRYSVFLTFAFVGFLIGAADPIVHVWLGRSYPYVSAIIFWLSLGYAVNSLAGVGTTILRASGKPRYETYYTALAMLANLASTIVLARAYGIVGVAMGTAVGWFAGTAYFLFMYHRIRNASWWVPIGSPFVRLALSDLLASAAIFYIVHLPFVAQCFGNRLLGLVALCAVAAVHLAVLTGISIIMGVWVHDGPEIAMRFARLRSAIT
jgi:O-antigen/teichoic acid export membrane protein